METLTKIQAINEILNEWQQSIQDIINNENETTDNTQLNTQIETIQEIQTLIQTTTNNNKNITDEKFTDYVIEDLKQDEEFLNNINDEELKETRKTIQYIQKLMVEYLIQN